VLPSPFRIPKSLERAGVCLREPLPGRRERDQAMTDTVLYSQPFRSARRAASTRLRASSFFIAFER
jgi:hypothetical protein